MKIILATHNNDKVKEFQEIIQDPDIEFISLLSLGDLDDVEENGKSYLENAEIKAVAAYKKFGGPVLADDSGLSVDLLDGYPGIYSARFAGVETSYKDKSAQLWHLLDDFPQNDWTASFICGICYIDRHGNTYLYEGRQDGLIIPEQRGQNGFGYDPIFYSPVTGKTNAEISGQEKHALSHRGKALRLWYRDYKAGKFDD